MRIHLQKNNISIPNLNKDQDETTEEDQQQNTYSQYKELETKYKYLEVKKLFQQILIKLNK